ncbi:unnamed protein product [Phytophthora lilii]|uniref:Unnamed protein product n=1 Tax=Phytophthora lilii TaxID=2077276 RepID=A0A9W7CRT7_9STRA|nr:unnamed protein product [Phytophthora lilii]
MVSDPTYSRWGVKASRSSISRIKLTVDELNHGDRLTNYQNLESNLKLMARRTQDPFGNSRRPLTGLFCVPALFQVSEFEWQERKENNDHWVWFLSVVKEAWGDLDRFTIVSDRQKGLLSAVETVFPNAGHRFCLRHIKSNLSSKGTSLAGAERGTINKMARSDCEADYTLFERNWL